MLLADYLCKNTIIIASCSTKQT